MTDFGRKLREQREKASITQGRLAERAGISRVTVQRLEAGEFWPRYPVLLALALALRVEPAELLPSLAQLEFRSRFNGEVTA